MEAKKIKSSKKLTDRECMELAIEEMKKSKDERRTDEKVNPKVGAILLTKDGKFLDGAHRGELRDGDHAEFTVLERKHRHEDLTDCILYATLEPCAPGARKHPKLACAQRIINARIKKVWVGIEDPDLTVDRKGIKYLQDNGVEVEMFDEDLQNVIRDVNKDFISNARERAKLLEEKIEVKLNDLENELDAFQLDDFLPDALNKYKEKSGIKYNVGSEDFSRLLLQQGFLARDERNHIFPTGNGLRLFGKNPSHAFPNSIVKLSFKRNDKEPQIEDLKDCLVLLPDQIESWLKDNLEKTIKRSNFERSEVYEIPIEALREAVLNALVHSDYSIQGGKVSIEIDDNKIVIKSLGLPVSPVKLEDLQNFSASSLSRNPKIMFVFDELKFTESRGIGMTTFNSMPKKYHLPKPSIKYNNPYLIITFFRNDLWLLELIGKEKYDKLNDEEKKYLIYIYNIKNFKREDFEKEFDLEKRTALRYLDRFRESDLDLIWTVNKGKSTTYKANF